MKISFYGNTDKGRVRKANEDFFANKEIRDGEYLFIVADGMGGHQAGDVASKLGTETFVEQYRKLRKSELAIHEALNQSIKEANSVILAKASADISKKGMGTTFSALVLTNMKANIVHVGDSRIYRIRDNQINKITTDHTFVEKMMEEGRLSEEEARNHPQKNILYMSLGARESFAPIIITDQEVKEGDLFIMCSDGLNNMVTDNEIVQFAETHKTPRELVEELIKRANENGGTDNITIQAIQVGRFDDDQRKTEPLGLEKKKTKIITTAVICLLIIMTVVLLFVFDVIQSPW